MADTPRGAGIVTAVSGQATLTKVARPQPIALKFRDEVYRGDKISTGEHSLVRVLLGGKALVTVRELSDFTITEEQDRPTLVEMVKGKLVMAVARLRMRPGEVIEVRTPNAVAAVRGTVLVVEVTPASSGLFSLGSSAVTTTISVLKGFVEVTPRDPVAKPVTVGAFQSVSVTGATMGPLRQLPPVAVDTLRQMGKAPLQHTESSEEFKKGASEKELGKATALAMLLSPGEPKPEQKPSETAKEKPKDGRVDPELADASAPVAQQAANASTSVAAPTKTPGNPNGAPVVSTTNPEGVVSIGSGGVPDVQINGTSVALAPGESLMTFVGTSIRTGSTPVVQITDATVSQSAPGSLINVAPGANATIGGSLLNVSNSTLNPGSAVILVQGGLTQTGPDSLIEVSGPVTVNGTLLTATNGLLTVPTSKPLLDLAAGTTLSVGGSLLDLTNTPLNLGNQSLAQLSSGSSLSMTAGPAIRMNGGSLTLDSLFQSAGPGNTIQLTGSALDLSNATVTMGSLVGGTAPTLQRTLAAGEPAIRLTNSTLNLTRSNEPLVMFEGTGMNPSGGSGVAVIASGSTINTNGPLLQLSGGNLGLTLTDTSPQIQLAGTTVCTSCPAGPNHSLIEVSGSSGVQVAGPLLSAVNSTITIPGNNVGLLEIPTGVSLTATSLNPLFSLSGGSLAASTLFDFQGSPANRAFDPESGQDQATDRPLKGAGVCPSCPVQASLLEASGASIGSDAAPIQRAISIDAALLEATMPLIQAMAATSIISASDLISLAQAAKVTSVGPVLALNGSSISVLTGSLINLAGGSFLRVTGDLLVLSNGSLINIQHPNSGFLIAASGGSVLNVSGALVAFGGTGNNSIVVGNNRAPTDTILGIPIRLTGGAQLDQVSITGTPIKGSGLGSISYPNGGSLVEVQGRTTRVTISGLP